MLNLYLIRHAASEDNETAVVSGGLSKTRLSEKGIIQAKALGNRLAAELVTFDEVYSSPAERALETAKIVCQGISYPLEKIIQCNEFLELSQGILEGRPKNEVYTPELMDKIYADPWNFKVEGGESQKEVEERTHGWIRNNLLPKYEQNLIIAIFSHAMALRCLLRGIRGSDPKLTAKIPMDNASITKATYDGNWHVAVANDTAHLLRG